MATFPRFNSQNGLEKKTTALEILQYLFLVTLLLYFGKTVFIPLSFALLISLILYPICKWLEAKGFSKSLAIASSLTLVILSVLLLLLVFIAQIFEFSNEWHILEVKIEETLNQLSIYLTNQFGINEEKQLTYIKNTLNQSGTQAFSIFKSALYSLTETFYYLLIVPLFSALILYYRHLLVAALYSFFSKDKKEMIQEIITETIHEYYKFIKGMLLVYTIVGILNSIGLALIGIPYPILFGFTASLLTFIPYIGILVSSLLPITIAWITFNSFWYPIGVIIVFGVVQILEAYIIFPYAVGSRLKINTLAILVVILVGGILWGTVGMLLFIPFLSIIKLIADRTESLQSISFLLSDGKSNRK